MARPVFTIQSRYFGPTDTKGSRIVARGGGRQATVHYDHALSLGANHQAAAAAVAAKLGRKRVTLLSDAPNTRSFIAE